MKSLKKQRRIQVILVAAIALVAATALIGYALRDGINFFRSPSQIVAEPPPPTEVFRIGGLVEEGSLERGTGKVIRFSVTDGGASVPVTYEGVLPDLFAENQGMVGTGTYQDGVFRASEILAKHDEDYMPREVIRFSVTDGGASVPVTYKGVLPDLFAENQGMVGTGTYRDGVFRASEILAKHDEDYMPREVIDSLKEQGVYQEPGGS